MNPTVIAEARSLTVEKPQSFMLAFYAGRVAVEQDIDTAQFLRSLLVDGHSSSAAGFLEGLAAANAVAGLPLAPGMPQWRQNLLRGLAVTR